MTTCRFVSRRVGRSRGAIAGHRRSTCRVALATLASRNLCVKSGLFAVVCEPAFACARSGPVLNVATAARSAAPVEHRITRSVILFWRAPDWIRSHDDRRRPEALRFARPSDVARSTVGCCVPRPARSSRSAMIARIASAISSSVAAACTGGVSPKKRAVCPASMAVMTRRPRVIASNVTPPIAGTTNWSTTQWDRR